MISNPIIFYIASVSIILFALVSLFAKNVIYSLLSAIIVFFFGSVFFYILGSEYNAIIQAVIYGFAVPIIIGLSIMFTNSDKKEDKKKSSRVPYILVMASCIFALAIIYLVMMSLTIKPDTFNIMELVQVNSFDTIKVFAKSIFVDYVWAFELVSLLLTIVIAGIGLLKKKEI